MDTSPALLEDLTVLDLSEGIAGPYCTKLLAALGARVIKVEPSGGGPTRRSAPFYHDRPSPEHSLLHLYLNTSKESITLNPDTASGASLLRRLAARAGVLVESYPPGVMAGWGLGYDHLLPLNGELIYVSVTPFGQDGPYRDYRGGELVLEALGALLYPMGLPEREPLKMGGSPALMAGGVSAFSAIMLALHQRDMEGGGQYVDVSLLESTLVTQLHATIYSQTGDYDHPRRPSQLARTADGWVNVGIQDASWKEFCHMIGRPELAEDPRFVDMVARRANADDLNQLLSDWLRTQPKLEVYHRLQQMRSIAGYVATIAELFESEQLKQREFFQPVDHPVTGPGLYPGPAFRIAGEPWRQGRAPLLGEHNEAVYSEFLGLEPEDLVRLRAAGAL